MEAILACDDATLTLKIQQCLGCAEVEFTAIRSFPLQDVLKIELGKQPKLVIFGSQRFGSNELSLLKQLCAKLGSGSKVVAVGPPASSNIILQTIRCGAVDYLDISGNVVGELRALIERVELSHGGGARVGRLFTVLGAVGGAGTSLLATNLAAALAQLEPVCVLLDMQLRGGDLATLLKSAPRHTLLSLGEKAQHLDQAMFDQSLVKHECGVHLLASPEPFSDYRKISPQLIQMIVQLARAHAPNVVVDLEDAEHPEQVRTLAASDRIVLPLRLDFVSLYRTKKCIDHLLRANVQRDHLLLVANRTGQPRELPVERVAEILEMSVDHRIPDDPAEVNASVNLGVPFVVSNPGAKVATTIVHLAEALLGMEPGKSVTFERIKSLLSLKSAACLFGSLPV